MNITALYEALDSLVDAASMLRDEFATDGDLVALRDAVGNLADTAWTQRNSLAKIIEALQFRND